MRGLNQMIRRTLCALVFGVVGCTPVQPTGNGPHQPSQVPSVAPSASPGPVQPVVGQWREVSASPLDPTTSDPQIVWVGDSFLVIDTWNDDLESTGLSARLDPSSGLWRAPANLPVHSQLSGDAAILDGHVYVNPVAERAPLLAYDLSSDEWKPIPLPEGAGTRQECVERLGDLLVVCTASEDGTRKYFTYQPRSQSWSPISDNPAWSDDATSTSPFVADGRLTEVVSVITDGKDLERYSQFDLVEGKWTNLTVPGSWSYDVTPSGEAVLFQPPSELRRPSTITVWDWSTMAPREVRVTWDAPGESISNQLLKVLDSVPDCTPDCARGTNLIDVKTGRGFYLPAAGHLDGNPSMKLTEHGPAVGAGWVLEYDGFVWYLASFR